MAQLPGAEVNPQPPNVGEAFSWATRDSEWITKLLLMGLVGLIPIVGGLQQSGWLLTMLDNLRAGRYEVPPAGFRYATRGIWLWLAGVIYSVVFVLAAYAGLIVFVLAGSTFGFLASNDHGGNNFSPLALLFVPFFFVWIAIIGMASLAVWIFVPAVIEFTDRKGLEGAFDVAGIVRALRVDPQHNLAAAALSFVAYFIAELGTYLCLVGVIFSAPYGLTVLAGVLRWYETSVRPETLPSPSAALAR